MTIKLNNTTDNKKYVFGTVNGFERNKNFNIIVAPLPKGDVDQVVINALMGVESTITISFDISPRTDDYTDGTGTPVSNSIDAEANWLYDTVCGGSSKSFTITRTRDSKTWVGSLSDISIPEIGEQPNKIVCRIVFKEGVIPTV